MLWNLLLQKWNQQHQNVAYTQVGYTKYKIHGENTIPVYSLQQSMRN